MSLLARLRRLLVGRSHVTDDERWVGILQDGRLSRDRAGWLQGFLRKKCHSPIERIFAAQFIVDEAQYGKDKRSAVEPCCLHEVNAACLARFDKLAGNGRDISRVWCIIPQVSFRKAERVDFVCAVCTADKRVSKIAVECDGYDYHAADPIQAAMDSERSRYLQGQGIPVFRFTGREICRAPNQCVNQVKNILIRGLGKP